MNSPVALGADNGFHSLDPRHIVVDRIAGLIFAAVATFGSLVGLLILAITRGGFDLWWIGIAAGAVCICLLLFVSALIWPPIEYRWVKWRLNETGLEIHRGVIWRHRISIPIARLQHADVSQGPLQRYFELGKLTVHTAGTQNASVELNGLAFDTAIQLRDRLLAQRKAVDVL